MFILVLIVVQFLTLRKSCYPNEGWFVVYLRSGKSAVFELDRADDAAISNHHWP